jgi:hypothetical protein
VLTVAFFCDELPDLQARIQVKALFNILQEGDIKLEDSN